MTQLDQNQTETPFKSEEDKKPSHTLYATQTLNGNKVRVRVGVAWKHNTGHGFNIALDNLVAFANTPKEDLPISV